MFDEGDSFCEDVSNHVFSRTIENNNRVILNAGSDEVITDVDMFRTHMELAVGIS